MWYRWCILRDFLIRLSCWHKLLIIYFLIINLRLAVLIYFSLNLVLFFSLSSALFLFANIFERKLIFNRCVHHYSCPSLWVLYLFLLYLKYRQLSRFLSLSHIDGATTFRAHVFLIRISQITQCFLLENLFLGQALFFLHFLMSSPLFRENCLFWTFLFTLRRRFFALLRFFRFTACTLDHLIYNII